MKQSAYIIRVRANTIVKIHIFKGLKWVYNDTSMVILIGRLLTMAKNP